MASERVTAQGSRPATGPACLTARQAEILRLAAAGLSGKQIARRLGISVRTVEYHFAAMRQQTGARSLGELIAHQTAAGTAQPVPGPAPGGPGSQAGSRPGNQSRNGAPPGLLRDGIRDDRLVRRPAAVGNSVRIGYATISTRAEDQAQLDALAAAHCREVIVETGSIPDGRPELRAALGMLRAGDTLVIYRAGRIARSITELLMLVDGDLYGRGINLHILSGICAGLHRPDGATIAGKMLFMVAAIAAEIERDLTCERALAGLRAGPAQGRGGGRPAAVSDDVLAIARARCDRGESVTAIARHLGIGRSTLYRALDLEHSAPRRGGGSTGDRGEPPGRLALNPVTGSPHPQPLRRGAAAGIGIAAAVPMLVRGPARRGLAEG
jgi:DNA invertase Pin-like site-specific DNA recombinase